jgi:hypothetical protein
MKNLEAFILDFGGNESNEDFINALYRNKYQQIIEAIDITYFQNFDDHILHEEPQENPLPPDWERKKAPNGQVYYVNNKTRAIQWFRPT